jgi:enoyl-CoA hydratase/carnithine racemase
MSDTLDALREDKDGVAIVTLNRPQKLNAINPQMRAVIAQAVEDLRDRDDLRVLLIKSTGRYFTAGVDIVGMADPNAEPETGDREQRMLHIRRGYRMGHKLHDEMESIEKPIVAAIQGPCLGLGVEMTGSMDFRLATENAQFGLPEIDIGVIAGSGGTSRFTRLCGIGWSKWLSVAGEKINAQQAMMAGFVQAIYPVETFEQEVWEFCMRLQTRPAEVQGVAKLAVELCYDLDKENARHVERIVNTPLLMRDRSHLVRKVLDRNKK